MSGSETGIMSSPSIGMPRPPPAASLQPVIQSMRMPYNTDGATVYNPISGNGGGHPAGDPSLTVMSMGGNMNMNMNMNMNIGEPMKKKRGRPRKYGPDGSIALSLSSAQSPTSAVSDSPNALMLPPVTAPLPVVPVSVAGSAGGDVLGMGSPSSSGGVKKPRGRPPGSGKKHHQYDTVGSVAIGFTPHVIIVKAGEDLSSRIMSFAQNGPRGVCILSANGAISNVTLRQSATSGGTVTYEGRFEILSLSGSFMLSESGGQRSRTGGLSVSLAGPDGRVLGGGVAGVLTAATPVQVVVGSFVPEGQKLARPVIQMEAMSAPPKIHPGTGATGGSSPPSRGTLSESSGGGSGSPFNQDYRSMQ